MWDPSAVVVMGASSCGKSTIASMLAHRLNLIFEEGDWFHPQSNIEKMHSGEPLTDEGPGWRALPPGFEALEESGPDECPIVVSIVPHPREIVDLIVDKLGRATVPELTKLHPSEA
jgi:hypothetical protein